ncbi:hypothetical protein [Microbacterium sp.]|uniref:hypothetical protein n=1 Tax=Microbacterium sp. TaxID=51671 RepID=UPI003735D43C
MAPAGRLPDGSILLHIGPYKTGSTAIQAALHQGREELRGHGVLYAGTGTRAMRAGWAVIGSTPRGRPTATIDEWHSLVEEVREASEPLVCISTEDFGRVGPEIAGRIVTDLGPDRVHVVTVVRRLDKLLPSQWQQRAQSWRTESYEEYLRAVLSERPRSTETGKAVWQSHDLKRQLKVWSDQVGTDRVIAIVADESDRSVLPRAFESLLGLPDGVLQKTPPANPSLSYNGVEMLRRLNLEAQERGWPDEVYYPVMRRMVHEMKEGGRGDGDRAVPGLPAWAEERVRELSERRADVLASSGVRIVGDPDALREVVAGGEAGEEVQTLSIDSAVRGLAGGVAGYQRLESKPGRRQIRRVRLGASGPRRRAEPVLADVPARALLAEAGRRTVARGRRVVRRGEGQ